MSLGHTTVMATAIFFGAEELRRALPSDQVGKHALRGKDNIVDSSSLGEMASLPFPWEAEFAQQQELLEQLPSPSQGSINHCEEYSHAQTSPMQYCFSLFMRR